MIELIAAAVTPYRTDGTMDIELYTDHLRRLLVSGCDGVLVGGSTGEAASLSVRERIRQLEQIGQAHVPVDRVMAGIGSCSLPDSLELAQTALDIGILRLLWCPPFYYTPPDTEGLIDFLHEILRLTGAERARVLLYHIPKYSGVPITPDLVRRLMGLFPEQIAGIKDSGGDPQYTEHLLRQFPRLSIYSGSEKSTGSLIKQGMAGIISATFNIGVCPEGDRPDDPGRIESTHLVRLENRRLLMERFPLIPAVKSILAAVDGREAWRVVRPPLVRLDPASARILEKQILSEAWIPPSRSRQGGD